MQIKRIQIPNARLQEGAVLPFTILRFTSLDNERYFVLEDPAAYRLLMPYDYYAHYGFEPGQRILCRIDKVNCNGRVFLEPMHPCYTEGKVYAFERIRSGKRKNLAGSLYSFLIVRDLLGKEWEVIMHKALAVGKQQGEVKCLVERIKKGILYLRLDEDENMREQLQPGQQYSFYVEAEQLDAGSDTMYFILKDAHDRRHLLRKKHFQHYGIRPGMQIRCKAGPMTSEGWTMLEPEHPCYRIGEVYEWVLDHVEELLFSDGSIQMVMVLKDCFGEDLKLHVDTETARRLSQKEHLSCRVVDIKKSRLSLELLPDKEVT